MKNKKIFSNRFCRFYWFSPKSKIIKGHKVIGIDNFNNYYSVKLKKDRNQILNKFKKYSFIKIGFKNFKDLNRKLKMKK